MIPLFPFCTTKPTSTRQALELVQWSIHHDVMGISYIILRVDHGHASTSYIVCHIYIYISYKGIHGMIVTGYNMVLFSIMLHMLFSVSSRKHTQNYPVMQLPFLDQLRSVQTRQSEDLSTNCPGGSTCGDRKAPFSRLYGYPIHYNIL